MHGMQQQPADMHQVPADMKAMFDDVVQYSIFNILPVSVLI